MAESTAIRVCVRVRPFNEREKKLQAESCVRMSKGLNQVILKPPNETDEKTFTYDKVFDSFVPPMHPNHSSNDDVWNDIGVDILDTAFLGYNVSLFAYGQTGSGKSHSMVGFGDEKGIIPMACEKIFEHIENTQSADLSYKVETSMMELYNEKIRDLLVSVSKSSNFNQFSKKNLKVREHPKHGPYVEGLKNVPVSTFSQITDLMEQGVKNRTMAATNMNETSSRAHTILVIKITQTEIDRKEERVSDKTSNINLVDLAGSERAEKTGAKGDRLKEGAKINQSLLSLGNVITALAEGSKFIPYRNSILTHLLKNALGGNAKTTMLAAISPANVNFEETLSTLKYANRAKMIKNKAIVNEDPNEKLIRELREEMSRLREELASSKNVDMKKRLEEEKHKMWVTLQEEMKQRMQEFENAMADADSSSNNNNNKNDNDNNNSKPFLMNLNEDPSLTGVLKFYLEKAEMKIGTRENDELLPDIILGGLGIKSDHATIHLKSVESAIYLLTPIAGARTLVNGKLIKELDSIELKHNDRIVFGNNTVLRFVNPLLVVQVVGDSDQINNNDSQYDWHFAMKELNQEIVAEMSKVNKDEEEGMKLEKEEMERKLKELEAQLVNEKMKTNEMSKEQTKVQEDLMSQLTAQINETQMLLLQRQRALQDRSILDENLIKTLPLIFEANTISTELSQGMSFSLKLISKTTGADVGGNSSTMDIEINILVTYTIDLDAPKVMWNYEKFHNRIYIFREMYLCWKDNNKSLKDTDFERKEMNPFYDPPVDQVLGVARLQLEAIRYILDVDGATQIIDYKGKAKGELVASIVPIIKDVDLEEIDELNELLGQTMTLKVSIHMARGLPEKNVKNYKYTFVKFRLLSNDEIFTRRVPMKSINPKYDYTEDFEFVITQELIDYVTSSALALEVWAGESEHFPGLKDNSGIIRGENDVSMTENEKLVFENMQLKAKLEEFNEQMKVIEDIVTPRTKKKILDALKRDNLLNIQAVL